MRSTGKGIITATNSPRWLVITCAVLAALLAVVAVVRADTPVMGGSRGYESVMIGALVENQPPR